MLTANDYRGLYAILPTPATPGADRMAATDTVNLDETEWLVNKLISDGVDGLIALGTTGECATLSDKDYRTFASCVLETVAGRIPTIMGASALGSATVVERLHFLRDLKASGTLLGLPMWQPATTPMAVDFYAGVSELFPQLAVMVYANKRAFRYDFPLEFWRSLVRKAPTVTAAKFSRPKDLKALHEATEGRIHIMPNESTVATFFASSPATTTSCWATAAAMGVAPAKAMIEAVLAQDSAKVASLDKLLHWANEPVGKYMSIPETFAKFNIQIEKARINAAGYCDCGPVRAPYNHLPQEIADAAAECGARWQRLCTRGQDDGTFSLKLDE